MKTHPLCCRVTVADYEWLKRTSQETSLSMANLLRMAIGALRRDKTCQEAFQLMTPIGKENR